MTDIIRKFILPHEANGVKQNTVKQKKKKKNSLKCCKFSYCKPMELLA